MELGFFYSASLTRHFIDWIHVYIGGQMILYDTLLVSVKKIFLIPLVYILLGDLAPR